MRRTILITGASSGIGKAAAELLIDEGHTLINVSRRDPKIAGMLHYTCDFNKTEARASIFKQIIKEHPEIDTLVCNSGISGDGSAEQLSMADVRKTYEVNFFAVIEMISIFVPHLKQKELSHIVLIGSKSALQGSKFGGSYCSTKFALRGFSQSLREECASSNVHINLINPGFVTTHFHDELNYGPGTAPDESLTAGDVAKTISFCLSMRAGSVCEEITLAAIKKVVRKKP